MATRFQVYKDTAGEWRWRLRASNGEPIARGGEGFKSEESCRKSIDLVKKVTSNTPVETQDEVQDAPTDGEG